MSKAPIFISEIKAHCHDPSTIRKLLLANQADYKGEDHQIDTYFEVPEGRLKIREGNIENSLIYYNRVEVKGIKSSNVELVQVQKNQLKSIKSLLSSMYSIKAVVDKKREIYFIDNVKFHIDVVQRLGNYVEIEAINTEGQDQAQLEKQCRSYCELFELQNDDYIDKSYSDLIIELSG